MSNEVLKERYDALLKQWNEKVVTWADFFSYIEEKVNQFRDCTCPVCALEAIYTMHAFFIAMRDNPEEGDVNKLVEYMVQMLVYESKEKLGLELTVSTDAERQAAMNRGGLFNAFLRSAGPTLLPPAAPTEETPAAPVAEPKKRLH